MSQNNKEITRKQAYHLFFGSPLDFYHEIQLLTELWDPDLKYLLLWDVRDGRVGLDGEGLGNGVEDENFGR